ncbi:hypothetical protein CH276_28025 [Rhodococcus sp. 06-470-2]|uniref:Gp37-like protein n=1 Tax=unclassified Rhodococcus (in: high G+C Gram-positive bacteria) TaxID=192944 RepID=UPI000B9ABCF7|nr:MULTISPECIES: hypothetical protein [unclassified Rhodococcus (in: high G+C Gram-positive bacteria)]OZC55957.1 hypothetical protein CH276_28025 [Rhodococcus sp. 06-470-2]OZE64837.1 hypothetical protein CH265_10345 [Rhodococcus sp. 05-2221-1B]
MTAALDEGVRIINERFAADEEALNAPPLIHIRDKSLAFVGVIEGQDQWSWEDICNDAGEAWVDMPAEDDLSIWLLEQPVDADIFLVFETKWKRETYKVVDIETDRTEDGVEIVRPVALHIFDETKHIQCWPNTMAPLAVQAPKVDLQAGNAISVIKGFAHRNLWREQAMFWIPGFDIWSPSNWQFNFRNADWPMVMLPLLENEKKSMWTVLGSRMDNFYDLVKPTLEDAGLQLVAKLWLPGDNQPAPNHMTLDRPTICFNVIQRKPVSGITGTIFDALLDLIRIIFPDGTTEDVTIADPNDNPSAIDADTPWVIWRKDQHLGLRSKMTIHKPQEHTITTGGKSPDAINSGAKLISNILLGMLGQLIGMPWLTLGIFDKAVEDVILAWAIFTDFNRKAAMGRYSHKSGFESGGGVAVSPSGLQTGRVGLFKARGYVSFAADVDDGSPYVLGKHVDVGQHCGFEVADKIWLSNIASAKQSGSRTEAPMWTISVGDYRQQEPPGTIALRHLETFSGALRQHASST